ncbi:hypothetical protein BRC73_03105 [Halobacteriales archaeon QH_7_66_37]|nr:MAG: hypothetical protein BRC73_03105 [Halobacteriales archaeon QH_7_66_37]
MSTPERTEGWRPTGTSTGVVAGVTLLTVTALLWAVPAVVEPTLLGLVGAACLTGSVWLVRTGGRDTVTAFLAGLLTVPAAAGLLGGAGVAALLITSRLFPVPSGEQVSVSVLTIVGNVGVLLGCVLALLGLALGSRNAIDEETLESFVSVGLDAGVVPVAMTTLLVTSAFLSGTDTEGVSTPDLHLSVLLSPEGAGLHLADFLLLAGVTAGLLAAALKQTVDPRVRKAYYGLVGGGAVLAFLGLVALPVELVTSPEDLRALLSGALYGAVRAVSTWGFLRLVLVATSALTALALVAGTAARTLSRDGRSAPTREEGRALPNRKGPLAAGALITVTAVVVADSTYGAIVSGVADQLPEVMGTELESTAADAAIVWGESTFVVLLATVLVATVVGFAQLLERAIRVGYLSTETAGYSLASAGLFVGVMFAATLDVPSWLVLGGVVASLLVWDAGRFGTTLGREVGSDADTRSIELVHAGGTALVGVAAAAVAALLAGQFRGGIVADSPLAAVALLSVVLGVLAFAAALR